MPEKYRIKKGPHPSGVENRNNALEWILKKVKETGDDSGVFFFADDDNTYDLRIFEQVNCYFYPLKMTIFWPGNTFDKF